MNDLIQARMIEGTLYIEATEYQLTEAKYQALCAEHEELSTKYNKLKTEYQMLRSIDTNIEY